MQPSSDRGANNFDILRIIASIGVLVSHSYPIWGGGPDPLQTVMHGTSIGEIAVPVFFVISGFLVAQSWSTDPHILRFLARRCLRLCPALFVVLLLSTFVAGPLLTSLPLRQYWASPITWDYLKGFGMFWLQGALPGVFEHNFYPLVFNAPLWTIRIETACYLLLMALGLLGVARSKLFSVAFALGAILLSAVASGNPEKYRSYSFLYMDAVSLMKLAALFLTAAAIYHLRQQIARLPAVAVLLVAIIFVSSGSRLFDALFLLTFPYVVLCFALIPTRVISRFAELGDYSYGVYLYAWPVQQTVMQFGGGTLSLLAYISVCLAITLGLAFLSWHLVEKHALAMKPRARHSGLQPTPSLG